MYIGKYTIHGSILLLMEEILHHLKCIPHCKEWDICHINWWSPDFFHQQDEWVFPSWPAGLVHCIRAQLADPWQRGRVMEARSRNIVDIFSEKKNLIKCDFWWKITDRNDWFTNTWRSLKKHRNISTLDYGNLGGWGKVSAGEITPPSGSKTRTRHIKTDALP